MQDSGNGEFGPVAYVRTTQTNAAAIRLHLRHRAALGKRAARPLWSGEWLKRAAAASKCLGKTLVAHFDHAVRDRVVEADLPEALLRDSAVREHARSATRSSAVGWALGSILGSKEIRLPVSLAASWPWRRRGGGSGRGGTAAPCQGRARRLPRRRSRRSTRRSPIGRKQEGSAVPLLLASWRFSNVISCPRLTVELHRASLGPSTAEPLVGRGAVAGHKRAGLLFST